MTVVAWEASVQDAAGLDTAGLDAAAARRWAEASVAALAQDRDAIDRINVFPVADGDTGTNLLHTMRAAVAEMDTAGPGALGDVIAALARGALNGARGNSGMLLSQVLRGVAEEVRELSVADGAVVRRALARADSLAARAIAEPVEGTLLSVLRSATEAADTCESDRVGDVVREATSASVQALEQTTGQLPALADAGVVDAGGRGLVVLLDVLHAVLHGNRLAETPPAAGMSVDQHHESRYAYEVMYLLAGADDRTAGLLRDRLTDLGDCVSVVGDGSGSWAVHVHCDDIGAAIESGIETGRVHQIKVLRFADQVAEHAILACVGGEALAELFRSEGAGVLRVAAGSSLEAADLVAAIGETEAAHVVLLPNGTTTTAITEDAARRALRVGQDVVVVPTASPVQGLAALAVHDPTRRRSEDAVAMAEAAAATRRGELVVAEQEALTWAGRCHPGDVLGLIDGEVVLIGDDVTEAATELVDRMLTAGGELVTALIGGGPSALLDGLPSSLLDDLPDDLADALADDLAGHLRQTHPEVEFTSYRCGDNSALLLVGVE